MPKRSKKRGRTVPKPQVAITQDDRANVSAALCNNTVQLIAPPVKSYLDDNNYRTIKLANGLTALLVSWTKNDNSKKDHSSQPEKQKADSEVNDRFSLTNIDNPGWCKRMKDRNLYHAKEAYFELCVRVGSYDDPREAPGTSHILSTTMFLHSIKYPNVDDCFTDWVHERNGRGHIQNNGQTTVYTFSIRLKYLTEALDRFSQNLASPVLSPAVITEIRDDSENDCETIVEQKMMNLMKQHLLSNLASTKDFIRTYGSEYLQDLSRLGDDKVYKEVVKFRQRHYSAHRMTIVLKAELSLDTLEEYVKKYFSIVRNNGLPLALGESDQYNFMNIFDESKYRRMYKMTSYSEANTGPLEMFSISVPPKKIELTWTMPPSQWLYRTKPEWYVAWLITHEGEGSLINYLRKKKLCTHIVCGVGDEEYEDNLIYTLFSLTLKLTDKGHKDYRQVVDAIFSYITFLRREGLRPKVYEELRQIEEYRFRYREWDLDETVKRLSVHMHLYPPEDYLTAKHLYFEYDPTSISTYFNLMAPDRTNIILYDETLESFNFDFPNDKIPEEWLESWENTKPLPDFKMPEPNVYRVDDFTLISVTENTPRTPVKIFSDELCEIWYGIGSAFRSPMCHINFLYISPLPLASPENCSMTDMLFIILQNIINDELYAAKAAGMTYEFSRCGDQGIALKITGFSQKLPLFMVSVAQLFADCSTLVTKDLFETTKKLVLTAYEERIQDMHEPDTLAQDLELLILKVVHWTKVDKFAALSTINFNQFQEFSKRFTEHVYVKCLAQGNITSEDVLTNVQKFIKISKCGPLLPNTRPQSRMHEIPIGAIYCRVQSFIQNSKSEMVRNYYQCGGYSTRARVMVELLTSILDSDVFEDLRLCQEIMNLDYSSSFEWLDKGVIGYTIEMSATNEDLNPNLTSELDMDIESLRQCLYVLFEEMTDKEWRDVLDIFMDQKKLPTGSEKLGKEVCRNWDEITAGTYAFNRAEEDLDALKKITIEDVRKWMLYLTTTGVNVRKISIQVDCDRCPKPASKSKREYRIKYLFPEDSTEMKDYCIATFKRGLKVLTFRDNL